MHTDLTRRLGIRLPIIQAPMAGGATTPELVAAVSNAGGLGSFAGALLPPDAIAASAATIRGLTDAPFAVNLFVLDDIEPDASAIARSYELLRPMREELGIPEPPVPSRFSQDAWAQLEAVIELAPPVASFTFALLDAPSIARLKAKGVFVIGTATNVAEARAWAANGADAVCAQGGDAGAHRGTFLGDRDQGAIGTMALVPQIVAAVDVPVIAAGGIMNGTGIAAALALGSQAAQLGTAFLNCREAGIAPPYKAALRAADDHSTRLTRAFSGRYARGIVNKFMRHLEGRESELPPYPIQNALTTDIRAAAAKAGRDDFLSLWAGQGVGLLKERPAEQPAAALVADLASELRDAARNLASFA